jgi:hypothetical protein
VPDRIGTRDEIVAFLTSGMAAEKMIDGGDSAALPRAPLTRRANQSGRPVRV